MTAEEIRLKESQDRRKHWKRWGPYLSERAWGTVREDYSAYGNAWEYFSHDHARSRAYRWNEDGISCISDRHQFICFSLALWNEHDPILKERVFGLTGNEGNHGEDPKEYYFYLDSTPTHSYMRMLYKYPQAEFPYSQLVEENRRRGRSQPEYELHDTGVFDGNRYFDVFVEYAKGSDEDLFIRITAWNRGPESAALHLRPTPLDGIIAAELQHWQYGKRWLIAEGKPELLFTENETNNARLFGTRNRSPYVKDAFHEFVIHQNKAAVNPDQSGTKMAALHKLHLEPGQSATVKLRLTDIEPLAGIDPTVGQVGIITSPGHEVRTEEVPGTNDFVSGFDRLFELR